MAIPLRLRLADHYAEAKQSAFGQVVHSSQLSRNQREMLLNNGFLMEVMKGWYLLRSQPKTNDIALWQKAFWNFVTVYLKHRYGGIYCLSAEASVDLWLDSTLIPERLNVITALGGNGLVELPNKNSIMAYADLRHLPPRRQKRRGVNVMPLAVALCRVEPRYFRNSPLNAELALRKVQVGQVSQGLLNMHGVTAANRIAGAYLHLGMDTEALQIIGNMKAAGFVLQPVDPFPKPEV